MLHCNVHSPKLNKLKKASRLGKPALFLASGEERCGRFAGVVLLLRRIQLAAGTLVYFGLLGGTAEP